MNERAGDLEPPDPAALATLPDTRVSVVGGDRLSLLDWLRILAFLEVLAFHIDTSKRLLFLGFGLPFFLVTTIALSVSKPTPERTGRFLRGKARRLLVPFAFWSFVYLVVLAARCWDKQIPFQDALSPWMLVAGTGVHLWFLPVAFIGGLAAHFAHRACGNRLLASTIVIASTLGSLSLLMVVPLLARLDWPLIQWFFSIPAIFFGYAAGRALSTPIQRRAWLLIAPVAIVVSVLFFQLLAHGQLSLVAKYCLAVSLVAFAFVIKWRRDPLIRRLEPLGYGIYLSHPCCIFALNFIERKTGVDLPFTLEVVVVFLMSCQVVWLMLRSPWLRRFV